MKSIHRIRKGSFLFLALADQLLSEFTLNRVIGIRGLSGSLFEEIRVSGFCFAGLPTVIFIEDFSALFLQITRGSGLTLDLDHLTRVVRGYSLLMEFEYLV